MALLDRLLTRAPAPSPRLGEAVPYYLAPGLLGSGLMAAGAMGVGYVAPSSDLAASPVVAALRTNLLTSFGSKILLILGAALLLQTWLRLGRDVLAGRVTDDRRLARLVWFWGAPLVAAPVLFSRDVFSYVAQARVVAAGFDPYRYGTGVLSTRFNDGADQLWATSPSPYGPLWVWFSSGVHGLTRGEATPALFAYRLLALAGVGLMVVFVPRLARACGVDPSLAVWLAVLNPLVLMHFVAAAHNDALMVGLAVAGLALAMERRPLLGAALVALAGAVKAPALVLLAFVGLAWAAQRTTATGGLSGASTARVWLERFRAWVLVGLVALAVFVALNHMAGTTWGWLGNLSTPARVSTWLSLSTASGLSLGALTQALGMVDRDSVLAVTRALGVLASLGVLGWLVLTAQRRSAARGAGLALLAVVLLGPVVQPWYLLWPLVVLAGAGLRRREVRVAVLGTTLLTLYTVSNSSASAAKFGSLPDGLAVLASVVLVGALVVGSRTVRSLLRDDLSPSVVPDGEAHAPPTATDHDRRLPAATAAAADTTSVTSASDRPAGTRTAA